MPGLTWKAMFTEKETASDQGSAGSGSRQIWNMGMLNDKDTIEVPGSVLLLAQGKNEPLGLRHAPARHSHSSLPTGMPPREPSPAPVDSKKTTTDGQIILDPQPDDSHNDPLNWPAWRRDCALLSLGLFCMVGGGVTPIIAAGFNSVAEDYNIEVSEVSLTTGLYMLGLAVGCVLFSPTAILYGKRPVYLCGAVLWIVSAVWCALSPNYPSLILARIFQGIAVSPVECLPSATIAEIFFLHERAFRIGIYTLLLLSGKNLVPLVSAVIIQSLSWRWVFWILAIVVAFCGTLLFFFVPETFWDRTPVPKKRNHPPRPSLFSRRSWSRSVVPKLSVNASDAQASDNQLADGQAVGKERGRADQHLSAPVTPKSPRSPGRPANLHINFSPDVIEHDTQHMSAARLKPPGLEKLDVSDGECETPLRSPDIVADGVATPGQASVASPVHKNDVPPEDELNSRAPSVRGPGGGMGSANTSMPNVQQMTTGQAFTHALRQAPKKSFRQHLKVHNGRINHDKWWKAAVRPFVLFAYPAVLWSAIVYACSIGWLIVISETIAVIYQKQIYNFNALQTGLIYISPFIGGVLGTAVAGKVSDVIVKAMARRNGGLYEPEFRLVMAAPVTISTVIGLMGFGWSAGNHDSWIVPTVFFGIVSFGCALGSTTSITFCVDSYRQYAGEALVTLNFSKNALHGLIFSLFVTEWLTSDGPKSVFIWIGVIQLILLLSSIPMYIYGKRARMWTVRKNFMENF